MMNWSDTVGQNIHAQLFNNALKQNPHADQAKLNASIRNMSMSVGITRNAISDVIDAEIEAIAFYLSQGEPDLTIDFLAGMLAAAELARHGRHVSDDNSSSDNW